MSICLLNEQGDTSWAIMCCIISNTMNCKIQAAAATRPSCPSKLEVMVKEFKMHRALLFLSTPFAMKYSKMQHKNLNTQVTTSAQSLSNWQSNSRRMDFGHSFARQYAERTQLNVVSMIILCFITNATIVKWLILCHYSQITDIMSKETTMQAYVHHRVEKSSFWLFFERDEGLHFKLISILYLIILKKT